MWLDAVGQAGMYRTAERMNGRTILHRCREGIPVNNGTRIEGVLIRIGSCTGCQTRLTTGWMFVYTIQPVNRFHNRVERTSPVRSTGCQTRLTTGCMVYTAGCQTGCTTRFDNQLNVCTHHTTGCQTGLTTGLFDNRLYRVNGASVALAFCAFVQCIEHVRDCIQK